MDDKLQVLRKMGYAGSLWDLLAPSEVAQTSGRKND